ncbi:hypothetical protein [Pelotomaculum propionicicum]|uniref:DUF7210 domain-containing protein n=1 Tax=Pelotomaculum propionicicum TaxID=258475 RepID=A0A4Y7RLF5_9FIRM|nr:hypothetical protein [Pelotomaculum propionicicum]TEB09147.1 hypothetical protein Pmgp_03368 [Pelotomaculum propionicicum]
MPEYVVLGHVKHNGEKYQAGEILELTEKEAALLLALKSVSKVDGKKKAQNADPKNDPAAGAGKGQGDDKKG